MDTEGSSAFCSRKQKVRVFFYSLRAIRGTSLQRRQFGSKHKSGRSWRVWRRFLGWRRWLCRRRFCSGEDKGDEQREGVERRKDVHSRVDERMTVAVPKSTCDLTAVYVSVDFTCFSSPIARRIVFLPPTCSCILTIIFARSCHDDDDELVVNSEQAMSLEVPPFSRRASMMASFENLVALANYQEALRDARKMVWRDRGEPTEELHTLMECLEHAGRGGLRAYLLDSPRAKLNGFVALTGAGTLGFTLRSGFNVFVLLFRISRTPKCVIFLETRRSCCDEFAILPDDFGIR